MEIQNIYCENAYSFLNFYVDFNDYKGSTTIILGKNKDQKTNNGAGKSTVLKMIFWSFYNKELNDENLDDMINRNGDNGLLSILNFTDRGHSYRITRYRNYKGQETDKHKLYDGSKINGSGLEFLINGQPFHGDSPTETQKNVEAKIRVTSKLFLSVVLMAQDSKANFIKANDTEKKVLLSELLDLGAYAKAFDSVKKEITDLETKITNQESKIENLTTTKEKYQEDLKKLKEDEANFEVELKKTLEQFDIDIEAAKKDIDSLVKLSQETTSLVLLNTELKTKNDLIEALKKDNEKESEAITLKAKSEADKKNAETFLESFDKTQEDLDKKLKEYQSNLVSQNSITELQKKINEITKRKEDLKKSELNLLISKKIIDNDKNTDITKILSDYDLLINKNINNTNNLISNLEKDNEKLTHQISELKNGNVCPTCKKEYKAGENESIETLIKSHETSLSNNIIKKKEFEEKNITLQNKLSELAEIREIFSKNDLEIKSLDEELKKHTDSKNMYDSVAKQNELYLKEIKSLETSIADNIKTKETHLVSIDKINNRLKNIESYLKKVASNTTQINTLSTEVASINAKITIETVKEEQIKKTINEHLPKAKENLLKIEENQKKTKAKGNPYTDVLKRTRTNISNIEISIEDYRKSIANWTEDLKYLNFWKLGFAPTGIRSFITDDVIELLNRKTQENLNDLFDGALTVLFDPESKNDKGVVSNKISTTFLLNGEISPFGMLSGGEQARCVLATNLALTEVAEARAGTKFNLRFLDEPFNGIDSNGQLKSVTLFNRLSKDKDGFFLISHDEAFQNNCQNAMYIVKDKKVSTMTDKASFDAINIISDEHEDGPSMIMEPKGPMSKVEKLLYAKKKKKEDEEDY